MDANWSHQRTLEECSNTENNHPVRKRTQIPCCGTYVCSNSLACLVQLVIIVVRVKKDLIGILRVRTWEIKANDHVLEVVTSLRHETPNLVLSVLPGQHNAQVPKESGREGCRKAHCVLDDLQATSSATPDGR